MRCVVAISGASGSIYGVRLLEELNRAGVETFLIVSKPGKQILQHETGVSAEELNKKATGWFEDDDLFAGPASGSYPLDAMIVVPCSMKTLAGIAHGFGDTLITRAGLCCLKEGKKLIVVIRESPLELSGIRNMCQVRENGGVVLPAMPAFYHKPQSVDDMVDFIVGKILDQLHIPHSLYKRWK